MDIRLTEEAILSFRALSFLSSKPKANGLLLGHKRGHRFFVEKVFLYDPIFTFSPQDFYSLNELFGGKFIGFFSFHPDKNKVEKIMSPSTYGKLFLSIRTAHQKNLTIKPHVIEFEGNFFLLPLSTHSKKRENHELFSE